MLLLVMASASGDCSALNSCSNVTVACSATSHLPPFVVKCDSTAGPSADAGADALAGMPQNTAMRPEQELLVTYGALAPA